MEILIIGLTIFIIVCNPKFDKNTVTGDILMWYTTLNKERKSVIILPALKK